MELIVSSFYLQEVDLVRKEKEIVVTILFIVPLPNDHIPKECYFHSQFRSLISRWTLRYFHFTRCIRCICYSKFQEIEGCIDDIYIYILSFHCCENDRDSYSDLAVGHRPMVPKSLRNEGMREHTKLDVT